MQITSGAFADGGTIPQAHAMPGAGGANVSVPLSWTAPPPGTRSLALSMVDPHPVARNWVHWLVINLPPEAAALAEGASGKQMPAGARELKNSWGKPGYGGPQPPPGTGIHPYVITVYALNVEHLDLKGDAGLAGFEQALQNKILASATITGYYGA
ncbi:MAG: YbhB/YbcL family Raf kinase inhibitor-like protein [Deltaproteobacteria bacterium]|nr:YbhB/YbcL family Raf kinase inhibitor-like protein [Deltaproteobacteria bacterium]